MDERKLNTTHKVLLGLVSNSLFATNYKFESLEVDWEAVLNESIMQSVNIIAFSGIRDKNLVPKEQYTRFEQSALMSTARSLQIHGNHSVLDKLFSENGIKYSILKGCASAYYYPRPDHRMMGDVDFIINEEDLDKAEKVMLENGFNKWEEDSDHHIVFSKKGMHTELHFEPAGVPEGEAGVTVRKYLDDIVDGGETVKKIVNFKKPSHFHHGLVLLLHTYHHLLSEGVGLRHLCDWAVFADSFTNEEFKSIFEQKLSEAGLWRFAQKLSLVSHEYLGLPYREWMGENDPEFNYGLISDIIGGGNFGRKDSARGSEGLLISDRGKNGVSKGITSQFVSSMNKIITEKMPICEKYKVLLAVGWVVYGGRYIFRMLLGKRRNIVSAENISAAKKRKELYSQFNLFEK